MESKIFSKSINESEEIIAIKKDISFLRTIKNKKSIGYVTLIGLKDSAHDQCAMFDTYEDAEEFHENILNEVSINEDDFITYENNADEIISIERSSISFLRGSDDKNKPGKVVIIGLKHSARNQHEFFESNEDYLDFMRFMTLEIS